MHWLKTGITFTLCICGSVLFAQIDANLDLSFGRHGFLNEIIDRNVDDDVERIFVTQADQLFSVGDDQKDILFMKMSLEGKLDRTFGTDGILKLDLGDIEVVSSAKLVDQKYIYVTGTRRTSNWSSFQIFIAKMNISNGNLDTTFGTKGIYLTDQKKAYSADMAVASDGGFFVTGTVVNAQQQTSAMILKVSASGVTDSTFGKDGLFTLTTTLGASVKHMVLQDDQSLVLLYSLNGSLFDYAVAKITPTGILDETFGINGLRVVDIYGRASASRILVDLKGRIYVCGSTFPLHLKTEKRSVFLNRLTAKGAMDQDFGSQGGVFFEDADMVNPFCNTALMLNQKDILLGGSVNGNKMYSSHFMVLLVDSSGKAQTQFGDSGFFRFNRFDLVGLDEGVKDMKLHKGNLYVGGYTEDGVIVNHTSTVSKLNFKNSANVGVHNLNSESLNLFPNPVIKGSTITLQGFTENWDETQSIELRDLQGRTIKKYLINGYLKEESKLRVPQHLVSGSYCLLLHNAQNSISFKIHIIE